MSESTIDVVATTLLGTGRATPETLPCLLYYARGISLGLGKGAAFSGTLTATGDGVACRWSETPGVAEMRLPLEEVLDVFGGFDASLLQAAIRIEKPWRRARSESVRGRDVLLKDFDLLAGFSEAFEWGEDVALDLGMIAPEGTPDWAFWLRIAMNIGRFEGHPWFEDAESRRLRLAIGLCEVPDGYGQAGGMEAPASPEAR